MLVSRRTDESNNCKNKEISVNLRKRCKIATHQIHFIAQQTIAAIRIGKTQAISNAVLLFLKVELCDVLTVVLLRCLNTYHHVELKIAYAGVIFALKFHFVTLPSCVYQKMFGLDHFGIRQSCVSLSWFVFFRVYSLIGVIFARALFCQFM